jgi:hypothetical protein
LGGGSGGRGVGGDRGGGSSDIVICTSLLQLSLQLVGSGLVIR